ncbi:MAG: helix-turn-helix domain-containing protein [Cytophagaceae bacterium]
MGKTDSANICFEMAVQFVNQTAKNIFLTGRAGTGKTTFLKHIVGNSHKKLAVVAPTGVAAINAGGTTIHSFFQLPLGSFLPDAGESAEYNGNFYNKRSLFKHLRLNSSKRELIQELDLLIIDEVSMVRADLLDAIDEVLRYVRKKRHLPFGGVQLLFIGDLFQLPPVVNDREWKTLGNYYSSPFFFHARVLKEHPPLYLELKKIYRQSDENFIHLLNQLRNNTLDEEGLKLLEQHYKPDFKPSKKGEYITLTTHNSKADIINQTELKNLEGKLYTFKAEIKGDFNDNAIPAEKLLSLKEGAQIMFIRNDKGEFRRYYNGKTGLIKRIDGDHIYVTFPGESEELLLEKETWKNVRYKYNKEVDSVDEEVKGTFTQFPIRLAWAITIHKSQGLTFDKAIIDAGDSFAPGQVYVALSRMTSLEGLILYSKISPDCISTDKEAKAFTKTELDQKELANELRSAQKTYIHDSLIKAFDWSKALTEAGNFKNSFEDRRIPDQEKSIALFSILYKELVNQEQVADRFVKQLKALLTQAESDQYVQINERVKAAGNYFLDALHKGIFLPLEKHYEEMKGKSQVKKYLKEMRQFLSVFKSKKLLLEQAMLMTEGLTKGENPTDILSKASVERKKSEAKLAEENIKNTPAQKKEKGETRKISLNMFREGKTIKEIASERGLVSGTIEGHLASFVTTGEIDVKELVNEEKINAILHVLNEAEEEIRATEIRGILGEEFTFGEIRAVMNYQEKQLQESGQEKS